MANRRFKTFVSGFLSITLICLLLLVAVPAALAEPGNSTTTMQVANETATPTISPTPSAAPSATPAPTPAPRKVLSTAMWEGDSVSMLVTNTGGPITVEAYIDDPSNAVTTSVKSGVSVRVSTNKIAAEQGQIIVFGFKAYENGTQIDSFVNSIVAGPTQVSPTPPPQTATLSGTIVDSATSAPIEGAEVVLKSQSYGKQYSAITDSSGSYMVANIYPDTYDIIVTMADYKQEIRHTTSKIEGTQTLGPISIQKTSPGTTPTPTPTPTATPTPSPASPLDAWINLLLNPTACIATAGGTVGLILSLTALYEWIQRQKDRRMREGPQQPPVQQPPKK